MKRLSILLLCLTAFFLSSRSQSITDTNSLRLRINQWIIPNGNKQITATQLNTLLNGIANLMKAYAMDSVYASNDTLYFQRRNFSTLNVKVPLIKTLSGLTDVNIASPSSGQFLTYNSGTSKWINSSITTTNIPEGTNLYFTNARARTAISSNALTGILYNSSTGVISADTTLLATRAYVISAGGGGADGNNYSTSLSYASQILTMGRNGLSSLNVTIDKTGIGLSNVSNTTQWAITGNASTVDGTNYIGTSDNIPLNIRVNNTASGRITSNGNQTYYGYQAGNGANSLFTSSFGYQSLLVNTGDRNQAFGYLTLVSNTTGSDNEAFGFRALRLNTTGIQNLAVGHDALASNTTGSHNIGIGYDAIWQNVTGGFNTSIGYSAGLNSLSDSSIFIGANSATSITTGGSNIVIGTFSTTGITTGKYNTIIGNNISGLSTSLSNNIILADGQGNKRVQFDNAGNLNFFLQSTVGDTTTYKPLVQDASGNVKRSFWYGAGGSGVTNLGYTQNALNNIITSSTGASATVLSVTTSLAGLADTTMKRLSDSIRNGTWALAHPIKINTNKPLYANLTQDTLIWIADSANVVQDIRYNSGFIQAYYQGAWVNKVDMSPFTGGSGGMADPGSNGILVRTATNITTARTITGTSNRLSVTNGDGVSGNPTLDISSSYVGQASLTTLGTIGTGTWQGTSIATTFTDAKIKTVTGTSNRLTIGGTSTDPTFDISSSYVGQSSITTLGTLTSGATGAGFTVALGASTITGQLATANAGTPSGGSTGQVLTKNSGTSYDYSWASPTGGSSQWTGTTDIYAPVGGRILVGATSGYANLITTIASSGADQGISLINTGSGIGDGVAVAMSLPGRNATLFMTNPGASLSDATGFYTSSSGGLVIYPGAKQAFRAKSTSITMFSDGDAGNVGIANSSPGEMLSLGTAGGTKGVLSMSGNTSGKVIIQPAAAAGTWTMTLPTTAGSNGQTIITDGSGVTSWGTNSILLDSVQTYTSGSTLTTNNTVSVVQINPSSTISSLTITLPATAHNSQRIRFYFGGTLTSGTVITSIVFSPNSGQTLIQASTPSSVDAGEYISYKKIGTIWFREN